MSGAYGHCSLLPHQPPHPNHWAASSPGYRGMEVGQQSITTTITADNANEELAFFWSCSNNRWWWEMRVIILLLCLLVSVFMVSMLSLPQLFLLLCWLLEPLHMFHWLLEWPHTASLLAAGSPKSGSLAAGATTAASAMDSSNGVMLPLRRSPTSVSHQSIQINKTKNSTNHERGSISRSN